MLRYTVSFTGTVQGVGFRYTTAHVARGFRITGWVRNEPDGSVKMVVEGEQAEVDRFLAAVQEAMSGNIRDTAVHTGPASGEHRDFFIAR